MRTVRGPLCENCGEEIRHVDNHMGELGHSHWEHITPPKEPHKLIPNWLVASK